MQMLTFFVHKYDENEWDFIDAVIKHESKEGNLVSVKTEQLGKITKFKIVFKEPLLIINKAEKIAWGCAE